MDKADKPSVFDLDQILAAAITELERQSREAEIDLLRFLKCGKKKSEVMFVRTRPARVVYQGLATTKTPRAPPVAVKNLIGSPSNP